MAAPETNTRLAGRWLALARSVWIAVVALALGLYVGSIPLQFADNVNQLGPAGLEQLRQAGLSPGFYVGYLNALTALFVLVFSVVAAVIFWRKSNDWLGLLVSLTLVLVGVNNNSVIAPIGTYYPPLNVLVQFVTFLAGIGVFLSLSLFPDGRLVPRWIRWLVPLVVVHQALSAFRPDLLGTDRLWLVEQATVLIAQIYRYWRVSNAGQRQQTKWVVFGTGVAVAGIVGVIVYYAIAWPGEQTPTVAAELITGTLWNLFLALIPLSIGMAILRARLWDIDLLIRRTLTYGALTALLALAYFGAVVALQAVFTALTGQQRSELVTVISTLVIAALFVPLRRRVQAFIDRRFYRRKYDAARTLTKFSTTLRDEVNLDDLSAHLLDAVDDTMQPESVALWLQSEIGDPSQTPKTGRS